MVLPCCQQFQITFHRRINHLKKIIRAFLHFKKNLSLRVFGFFAMRNMKLRLFIVVYAFCLSLVNISAKDVSPVAINGVLDLRQFTQTESFEIKLNGHWEFYWNKMLTPNDFESNKIEKPDYYGKVPSYWTDYPKNEIQTEKYGFATYKLTILLPPGLREPLAFNMPVFDSSYDLYLNGDFMTGNGITGTSEEDSEPEYGKKLIRFDPISDTISVIINVSNFDHRRGGFWLPVKFGTFSNTQQSVGKSWAGDWAIISLLLGFSVFFLIFYILYPKEKLMLFFSLAVVGLAFRPFFTTNFLIREFTDISWEWIIRFEYLSLILIMFGWIWFAYTLYYTKLIRFIAWTITGYLALMLLATLFTPVKFFSYATIGYYPAMIILMVYLLYGSLRGVLLKRKIDIAYFIALLTFSIGTIHDIIVSLGKSESSIGYSLSLIVVIFIFTQAILLLYKWVNSYSEKEKLQQELEFMNRNLEVIVDKRTKDLKETIQLKNKIFSVIAHDLRSPVVNILYMLNLLKEKEFKENYDSFADSCIQYSQSVISLLENMLVWGRGQEEKINYSPGEYDLAALVLTNLSIFKETASRKDININFNQSGNTFGYFDKDLTDIVIRNLLTNAVKYTNRGGKINVLVKENPDDKGGIMIRICDNGVGISEMQQKQLFSSIDIQTTPGTENEKGTGLGLKLSYELVKINNGILDVESKEGEGTCFSIMLPVQPVLINQS